MQENTANSAMRHAQQGACSGRSGGVGVLALPATATADAQGS